MTHRHESEYGGIFDSNVRGEIRKMLDRRELDRVSDTHRGKPRWLYCRPQGLSGPIAALEAQLSGGVRSPEGTDDAPPEG